MGLELTLDAVGSIFIMGPLRGFSVLSLTGDLWTDPDACLIPDPVFWTPVYQQCNKI